MKVLTQSTIAIARMAGTASRRRRMPRQALPDRIARDYARDLKDVINKVWSALEQVMVSWPGLLAASAQRRDSDEGDQISDAIGKLRARMSVSTVEGLATRAATRTAGFGAQQLQRQTRAALGVDLLARDRTLNLRVASFARENVALIRGVSDQMLADVEKAALRAISDGKLWRDLSDEIRERHGIAERRADLIARDQIGKLNGQINAARQKELGVTSFIWRTVNDERVRAEHEDRNGNTYSYDDPPDGELPGEPIQCRCYAEPVFTDILADL